jgi:prephenate dehydrogenase
MATTSMLDGSVLIVGTGLIGTSIGLSLRRAGIDVLLDDLVPGQAIVARELGAGQLVTAESQPQLVVVCVPPRHAAETIARLSATYPDAAITDVTSVKSAVLREAIALGADPLRLVGGHPMAGREVSGATAARIDLLDDRLWILTPGNASAVSRSLVGELVSTCGAFAVEMSPDEHDRAVALVSHVPQVLSSALAGQLVDADEAYVRVAGQGLRDMTRIAASDDQLWADILSTNAGPIAEVLDSLIDRLTQAREGLLASAEGGRDAQIYELLQAGATGQKRIPGKHGGAAASYEGVAVMLVDAPGELARLFAAAGDEGINTEDVRIEHILGRPSGLVEVFVSPDRAEALRVALRARGFDVRA